MADHHLIAGYRNELLNSLPSELADEVSDGLAEAHQRYVEHGLTPDDAARSAIAEFGSPVLVAEAFRRACPVWSAARGLIVTGPVVGGLWAATLLTGHASEWPIPAAIRLTAGVVLAAAVLLLATASVSRRYQVARRTCVSGSLALAALDASVTPIALLVAPGIQWLLLTAACASTVRLTYVTGRMRKVASWPGT